MLERYGHKIKTPEELAAIIGKAPRSRTVVMCHGVFDVVHPGHIRHLLFAKSKADLLVTSITCDEYITKGEGRPYVSQDLRAANLAALEMVDYVVIDTRPEPLENITLLQPDCFVKGFEYRADGLRPKTQAELEAVTSYGGQFLFSPGDIVFSSSALLAYHQPDLRVDKLTAFMAAEGVTFDTLRETLRSLSGLKVHVVGDTIVDKYSHCTLLGPTTKTPTFSVRLDHSNTFVGGAGIVAKHLKKLGADVTFSTILGDDAMRDLVLADLEEAEVSVDAVIDSSRPTTVKERFWADGYKLLQVDTVDNSVISAQFKEHLCHRIESRSVDAVVFSDFRHGVFQRDTIAAFTRAIPDGALKVADSQVSNRWGNILEFQGFDLITPNEKEARFALADQDSVVRNLAERLYEETACKHLLLKLGDRGLLAYRRPGSQPRAFFFLDSFAKAIVDTVGAGDALLATSTLVLARTGDLVQSSILGNLAAAVSCEVEGNVPVTREQIEAKLNSMEQPLNGPGGFKSE